MKPDSMPPKSTPHESALDAPSLTFAADTAALAELGAFLRAECAEHPRCILIELAVTEVVVNAIKHGLASNIRVSIHARDEELELRVTDDGARFDTSKAASLSTGELREGGYGVGIIQKAASELSYDYQDGWGTLTLLFPH